MIDNLPTLAPCRRMRKDPLDPIDNGTKVGVAFRRLTDPKYADEEAKKKAAEAEAAAAAAKATKKAGSWGGLPAR